MPTRFLDCERSRVVDPLRLGNKSKRKSYTIVVMEAR